MSKRVIAVTLVLFLFELLTAAGLSEQGSKTLHLKSAYANYFTRAEVECVEKIINAFESAYNESYETYDPRLLSDAYEVWSSNHDTLGKLSIEDPNEVANIKWDINQSLSVILCVAEGVSEMPSLYGALFDQELSLSEATYVTIQSFCVENSFGGDKLTKDNALDQFWNTASIIHDRILESYERY